MKKMNKRFPTLLGMIGTVLMITITVSFFPHALAAPPPQALPNPPNVQQTSRVDPKCLEIPSSIQTTSSASTNDISSVSDDPTEGIRHALLHEKRFPDTLRNELRASLKARSHRAAQQLATLQATTPLDNAQPGVIYGRVFLPDGSVAVESLVWLYPIDADGFVLIDQYQVTFSDADGIFFFEKLPVGDYRLMIEPPEKVNGAIAQDDVVATVGYPKAWVDLGDIYLTPATKHIQGTVLRDGNAPVISATISAFHVDTWEDVSTTTDSKGAFDLAVGGGEWQVDVLPQPDADWVFDGKSVTVRFAMDTSKEIASVALVVKTPDGYLTGKVLKPDGQPLLFNADSKATFNPSASFDVLNVADESYTYAYLKADGTFRVPVLAGLYDVWVWLDEATYPRYQNPIIDLVDLSTGTVVISDVILLEKNSIIEGTITNAKNEPVAGAFVDVWQDHGAWDFAETDATGAYSITVAAGIWQVEPTPAKQSAYLFTGESQEVVVAAKQHAAVDFRLEDVAGTIRGKVVDPADKALVTLQGWAYARRTPSNNAFDIVTYSPLTKGQFNLDVPAGEMLVGLVLAPGSAYSCMEEVPALQGTDSPMQPYEQRVIVAPQATKSVTMKVQPNDSAIQGVLKDKNGTTITGIDGTIFVSSANSQAAWQWTTINPKDGSFQIPVAAGNWYLSYDLNTDQYQSYPNQDVLITTTTKLTTTQNLVLTKLDGVVRGKVVDESHKPVATTYVRVAKAKFETFVLTNEQGEFETFVPLDEENNQPHLTAAAGLTIQTAIKNCKTKFSGNALLQCLRDAKQQTAQPHPRASLEDVETRQTVDVELVVRGSNAFLAGQVFDTQSKPVANAFVSAYSGDNQNANGYSGSDGCFRLAVALDSATTTSWWLTASFYDAATRQQWQSNQIEVKTTSAEPVLFIGTATDDPLLMSINRLTAPLDLKHVVKLQAPEMHTFKVADGWSYTMSDGTRIEIPGNAIPTNETSVQISLSPTGNLPDTSSYRMVSSGLTITIYEAKSGKKVTQQLKTDALIRFIYTSQQLQAQTSVSQVQPALYVADTWQPDKNYTVNTTDSSMSLKTNRFGTWALVTPQTALAVTPTTQQMYLPIVSR